MFSNPVGQALLKSSHRWRDWGSESSQNDLADRWQNRCSNLCVFGSNVWKYTLSLLYQHGLKNKIADIYSQWIHLFYLFLLSLSLCFPFFCSLPFPPSSLCFNLYVRPFQPNLPRSKRDSETLPLPEPDMERLNLWLARAPPPKGHVPAVILGDRVGGPFLRLNPSVACAQLSQQPKCWAHTSVPRQNPVAYGQSPQKKKQRWPPLKHLVHVPRNSLWIFIFIFPPLITGVIDAFCKNK